MVENVENAYSKQAHDNVSFEKEINDVTEFGTTTGRSVQWNEDGIKTTSSLQILQTPLDGDRSETPTSICSGTSSTRAILSNNGGRPLEINTTKLQQNHLGITMRDAVRHNLNQPQDDTTPKQPYVPNPPTGNGHSPIEQRPRTPTDQGGVNCLPRFVALIFLILAIMSGVVVVVYFAKESRPEANLGPVVADPIIVEGCDDVNDPLGQEIKFNCTFLEEFSDVQSVGVTLPATVGNSVNISINNMQGNDGWTASYSKKVLKLSGPNITCSSVGQYQLDIIDKDETLYIRTVSLTVRKNEDKVNIKRLSELPNVNTTTNFNVGCSTMSGCEHAFLDIFSQGDQARAKLDVECTMNYSDSAGYWVGCHAAVPSKAIKARDRLTCRPSSAALSPDQPHQMEAHYDLTDCDFIPNCGFKCVENATSYYAVDTFRCDIYHQCQDMVVNSSTSCGNGFFNLNTCACHHFADMTSRCEDIKITQRWCNADNDNSTGG